ncbi:MAG: hypothetical protein K6E76_05540 [Patescibacteria group bacterium]|nr:hypothetical protein [Patescibacteria group bacterium]
MNEGLLIFKFENGKVSSPWLEGFKCWIEEIKDVHVSFNFNEARGPVIAADNLGDAVKSYEDSIKESVQ